MGIKFQSPPLLAALIVSFLLGSAYSVEVTFLFPCHLIILNNNLVSIISNSIQYYFKVAFS